MKTEFFCAVDQRIPRDVQYRPHDPNNDNKVKSIGH
ncbi:hypothetical protein BMMGA3_09270 [Bacillus methanolicus MGA3]|uniref:Uncharacterized protein n=1 Tax=Bacillus methanolicus (strain MGA3 / ATCC 53907) TaxID=796606 RepID=A0A068LRC4_BACMM|nr:hypothetical protein BMMGA3_09270 [Bacillus methanolicus MGA3]